MSTTLADALQAQGFEDAEEQDMVSLGELDPAEGAEDLAETESDIIEQEPEELLATVAELTASDQNDDNAPIDLGAVDVVPAGNDAVSRAVAAATSPRTAAGRRGGGTSGRPDRGLEVPKPEVEDGDTDETINRKRLILFATDVLPKLKGPNGAVNKMAAARLLARNFQLSVGGIRDFLDPLVNGIRFQQVYQALQKEGLLHRNTSATCRECGRPLHDPDSVASGIGPACAKRVMNATITNTLNQTRTAVAAQQTQANTPQA